MSVTPRTPLLLLLLVPLAACEQEAPAGPSGPPAPGPPEPPSFPVTVSEDVPVGGLPAGELIFLRDGEGDAGNFGVSLARAGEAPRPIFTGHQVWTGPDFAPDGSKLAFSAYGEGEVNLWVVDMESHEADILVEPVVRDGVNMEPHHPTWGPDGDRLAYTQEGSIRVIESDGSNSRGIADWYGRLAWSPTSEWIAYAGPGLGLVRADGIVGPRLAESGIYPEWAPDGRRVAYAAAEDTRDDLFVVALDGSEPLLLAGGPGRQREPTWSPDGEWIAFAGEVEAGDPQLFRVRADGTGLQQLTAGPGTASDPAWSQDGRWIAFTGRGPAFDDHPDVYLLDLEERRILRLTDSPLREVRPLWRPEG